MIFYVLYIHIYQIHQPYIYLLYRSPYSQGRNTQNWGPTANQFRPERWFTENGELKRESQGNYSSFVATFSFQYLLICKIPLTFFFAIIINYE